MSKDLLKQTILNLLKSRQDEHLLELQQMNLISNTIC